MDNKWKTWIACGGLLALAVVDYLNGDTAGAGQKLFEALALFGIRSAVGRQAKGAAK